MFQTAAIRKMVTSIRPIMIGWGERESERARERESERARERESERARERESERARERGVEQPYGLRLAHKNIANTKLSRSRTQGKNNMQAFQQPTMLKYFKKFTRS